MIVLAGFGIGVLWGGLLARRRKGNRFDIAQYALSFGIAFALLALFVSIFIDRMA
ncbi:hypothetical protein [Frigidibacter mobilis]|uniref:PEP-CTERM protein-sorting domain-containing protein n=1 Tax=Frigidibacter mobilis TaxID=1335048 RepID=A0A161GLY7_9RHOB|nr:hypothetical protein [Frigidibacter mobilis]AMY68973.1 hypothetical protein AKL17_1721 [Frigidibacter mobilis]